MNVLCEKKDQYTLEDFQKRFPKEIEKLRIYQTNIALKSICADLPIKNQIPLPRFGPSTTTSPQAPRLTKIMQSLGLNTDMICGMYRETFHEWYSALSKPIQLKLIESVMQSYYEPIRMQFISEHTSPSFRELWNFCEQNYILIGNGVGQVVWKCSDTMVIKLAYTSFGRAEQEHFVQACTRIPTLFPSTTSVFIHNIPVLLQETIYPIRFSVLVESVKEQFVKRLRCVNDDDLVRLLPANYYKKYPNTILTRDNIASYMLDYQWGLKLNNPNADPVIYDFI